MTNAWQTTKLWDVYVALATVAVAVLVVVGENARPIEPRVGSAVTVLAIGAWYAVRGRRLLAEAHDSRALWAFLGVMAVLYAVATVLASSASFLSFALIPLFFTLTDLRTGIIAVAGLNLIPPVANLVRTGDLAETLVVLVPIAIVITVFSSVFAYWVHQIVRQSSERADLIEQLAASRAEVARLSRDAGVAAERQRLSGEIHDTIAQGLSSVVMLVQAAEADLDRDAGRARHHLEMAGRTAREGLAEARALVAGLSPAQLSGASLAAVLTRLAERFREETGIPVDARTAAPPGPLPMTVEVVLLRAAQEGLANVRKHAGATAVTLELAHRPGAAELTVTDNGVGVAGAEGFGLTGMRARVADVGGTLRVEPAPGGGTRLTVLVPA
ncbi:two-component sensor histidine kinase [Virgisporangium ochraceum]|uniref:Two-component sensor histidine kinase n=1 Tax=Virgisporangium ochraceum TaxID=65505 RepID=A0A8J3ZX98_9ACTN|nr:two-component sensor histidine kinase [Virgisporangium ochraceum]